MNHIDFSLILSSALTPITLISGVGLLLLTMSARYDHTTARVRQLLHADEMTGGTDPHLAEAIELIFHRAELLRKAILFVVLSAACAGLLVLTSARSHFRFGSRHRQACFPARLCGHDRDFHSVLLA